MPAHNILVVVVDGLRASALGAYGNTSFPTPVLDRFAADSFLLDYCYAPSADLAAIYRALWHPTPLSLPRQLAKSGYTTTLVTDEPELTVFGAANDFDHCLHLPESSTRDESDVRAKDASRTSLARLLSSASEVVAAVKPSISQFVWVHSRGMYGPWDAPLHWQQSLLDEGDPMPVDVIAPPDFFFAESDDADVAFRYACAYAAQTMALDDCWDLLESAVTSAGAANWLVTLIGARGNALGEHRRVGGVDPRLHVEQLHVPWLIRFPDGLGRLDRTKQLTTHADLAPTLADSADGRSIRSLMTTARPRWRDAVVATGTGGQRAIRTAEWCLRQDASPQRAGTVRASTAAPGGELYVRPDDRWEANDVAKLCPDVVESLSKAMDDALLASSD